MSEKSRRKRASPKADSSKRPDQRSDPKPTSYKIRRKIPDPLRQPARTANGELHDAQLALRTVATTAPVKPQPFLKWVGGKAQLLAQFDEFFPAEIARYFEPFIGGGAVFFHLKHRFPKMKAFVRDINPELPKEFEAKIRSWAETVFAHVAGTGVPRLDFLCNGTTREIWFNEANPCPGSFGFFLWEAAKTPILFTDLLDHLIQESQRHHTRKQIPLDPTPTEARLFKRK